MRPVADERNERSQGTQAKTRRLPWPIVLFLVGLVIPWVISIGPLRLSVYRIVLAIVTLPCLVIWARGGAGRIRLPDIAVLLYCVWGAICLGVNHGIGVAFQSGGILFVETAGAYMLARCYIRDADDFRNMVWLLFKIVLCLLPFGLIELSTGRKPLLELFGFVMPTIDVTMMDVRWGMRRVQGPFEHPLLFGVCCGSIFALTHLVLGYEQPFFRRWTKTVLAGGTAFLALSSGPTSALVVQSFLMGWNWVLRGVKARWKILWAGILAMYASISAVSNQSVPAFYITHAPLFDSFSAYYRLLEWQYGSQTVLNHPLFGIGLNEYERPDWILPSVDMFWLIHGIMFGLPAVLFIALAFIGTAVAVGLKRNLDNRTYDYRLGYLISMAGFFIVGWSVDFWNGTYSLFFFLVASGIWIVDVQSEGQIGTGAPVHAGRRSVAALRPFSVSSARDVGGRHKVSPTA
jgi:hypothetical protein